MQHALNQRSPAEGKDKGQKPLEAARPASFAPHALKGQKLLAQGIALGNYGHKPVALRAKALKLQDKAFALTGRLADCYYTQGVALG